LVQDYNQSNQDGILLLCCNNYWPYYAYGANSLVSLACNGIEQDPIVANICARYWSGFGNPNTLCFALPDPELPDIPVPSNFNVVRNANHNTSISWNWYYVHWYDIYRKIDNNSWQHIKQITSYSTNSWIDTDVNLNQGVHTYYYKMQGSVYDAYSGFTAVKSIYSFSVSLSGPGFLFPNQTGTFTANVTGGVSPLNYTWYKKQLCSGGTESMGNETDGIPCDVWIQLSPFNGSRTATACGAIPGFSMKVMVTDAANNSLTAIKDIEVDNTLTKKHSPLITESVVPQEFRLYPNFPNPFNSHTGIRYALPEVSKVQVAIYNLAGVEIKFIFSGPQSVGIYQLNWDGTDNSGQTVASGNYFCQLQALGTTQKFSQTQKLSLIK